MASVRETMKEDCIPPPWTIVSCANFCAGTHPSKYLKIGETTPPIEDVFEELLPSFPSKFHLPWLTAIQTMIKQYNLYGFLEYMLDISSIIIISHSICLCKISFQWLLEKRMKNLSNGYWIREWRIVILGGSWSIDLLWRGEP